MANRYVDDFDDDGLDDDYEGEGYGDGGDELSPEDREAMTTGTAEVRKQLGSDASKVTVKQIQDALWHYYYDVEKSVSYLQKTVIAPAQPKTAPKPATKKTPEAGKKPAATTKQNKNGKDAAKADQAASGISNLKISDVPPPKSKGLDVIKEFENSSSKRSVSFVVVGE
jgi:elongation factor 1 alpha-like protein